MLGPALSYSVDILPVTPLTHLPLETLARNVKMG